MDFSDPKFDGIFKNNVHTFWKKMEEQDRLMRKLSISEIPAFAAIRKLEKSFKPFDEIAKSLAAFDAISRSIKDSLAWQEDLNTRFKHIFQPVWQEQSIFKEFRDHTAHIASILNPPIGEYIETHIRTDFSNLENISVAESTFLEAFEQIEEEVDSDTFQEIAEELERDPTWLDDLKTLIAAFDEAFLTNKFAEAAIKIINRRFHTQHGKIIVRIILIIILLYQTLTGAEGLYDRLLKNEK
jgi:hypothetical protein